MAIPRNLANFAPKLDSSGNPTFTAPTVFSAGTASDPSITFTGDTNTGLFAPAADTIAFTEGGTEAMRIDSSGNVGIGTTSVTYDLEVKKTVAAGSVVGNINNPSSTGAARLYLGNDSGATAAYFQVFGSSHAIRPSTIAIGGNASYPLTFFLGDVERARITSDGYLRMASGSGGIQFNGDTAAANALDDYEEGTWTPAGFASGYTASSSSGIYTRIGRVIHVRFDVTFSAVPAGNSSSNFTGLPFNSLGATPGSGRDNAVTGAIYCCNTTDGSTGGGLNSYAGISNGSAEVFVTGRNYIFSLTYQI